MTWPITILFSTVAFALGWWSGRRRMEATLNTLSAGLKKSSDSLADALKKQQP